MGRLVPVTGRESVKLREPPKAFGTNPRFDNKSVGASGKTRWYGHNPKDKASMTRQWKIRRQASRVGGSFRDCKVLG
jgi:hypothetical protein